MALTKRTKTRILKKKAEPRKNVSILMTEKEKAKIEKAKKAYEKANGKKISLSSYVRMCALNQAK